VPHATAMAERTTKEARCRRFAAYFFDLAKSSRAQSERMLLLALAEGWLDLAEPASRRSRLIDVDQGESRDLMGAAKKRA
jgi:hypothetical protein